MDPVNYIMFSPPDPSTYEESSFPVQWTNGPCHVPFIICAPREVRKDYLMIYCHGNAMDLGQCESHIQDLANRLGIYCLAFDYRGYGITRDSGVFPCEKSASEDVLEIYEHVKGLKWPAERIILYGQSIGTGIATSCAVEARKKDDYIMALFLQSGYTSIKDVAVSFVGTAGYLILNRFNTRKMIKKLDCPLLLTHGDEDTVIPYGMSYVLHQEYKGNEINLFHTAAGKGHNNMSTNCDLVIPFSTIINDVEEKRLVDNKDAFPFTPSEIFINSCLPVRKY